MKFSKLFFLIAFLAVFAWSCLSEKQQLDPISTIPPVITPVVPNPNATCDSVGINYDKTIVGILQKECTSCHSGASPSGKLDLTTFASVATVVKNGKLFGAISHATGYSPMPSSTMKLSNCEILQIKKWIVAGSPNGATVIAVNPPNPVNPVVTPPVIVPTPPIVNTPCDPNVVYFKQQILPFINSNCASSGCHDTKSAKDGVILTDYKNILNNVSISSPSNSKLYKYLGSSMPPAPAPAIQKDKIAMILKWIQQGAKDNSCEPSGTDCNTTTVTFSAVVMPIFQNSCIGCHGNNAPSAGINLSTYANVLPYAKNGKLYGAISHATGFIPMPSATISLSACEISQLKKWIDGGMKND